MKRPMKRIVGPLREMGADIRAREDNFCAAGNSGTALKAIDYKCPWAARK
jgi:3-phosphoshikimate 1-carboxyvinyltransferase